jgi:uncharacterized protein YukJ
VYWVDHDFNQHPIIDRLSVLEPGFHLLEDTKPSPDGPRIDFIRSNLFNVNSGRVLPHDIEGPDNDIIDVLEPLKSVRRLNTALKYMCLVRVLTQEMESTMSI